MNSISRRSFLKHSSLAAAGITLSAQSWSQVTGANSEIRLAVIGLHGRGEAHMEGFSNLPGVRITALCDVDRNVLDGALGKLKKNGAELEGFTDIRKLLESKNVDAISIAMPNHWHSLAAIWGIQAGKDVYVEKPISHNVSEGRRTVEAARKYKKIVQTGAQARSSVAVQEAVAWVKAGNLGKIKIARGLCYKPRPSIGKVTEPTPIPASIDYDLWCGPAPMEPLHRRNLHYDWHWFWNTGNGDVGNQGVHQMDIARWFLGEDALSPRIFSVGGRLGYVDDGETPNTLMIYHDYARAPLIFEVRGLPAKTGAKGMDTYKNYKGSSICVVIECEKGDMVVTSDYRYATAYDKNGKEINKFEGDGDHFANFIKAVRSRKVSDLNNDILEGHLSAGLCHTGN
ncbi:MAG: Gfo/Idh/MocA family oxidoreductase, partial [Verrucomicrobiota bacterium]